MRKGRSLLNLTLASILLILTSFNSLDAGVSNITIISQ
jgi:hypothetical protein